VQIRDVVDEELEAVWSGKKDAKAALDEAVKRGNELLRKFQPPITRLRQGPLPWRGPFACGMEKRVTFNERWLPYLLVAPQMIITLVFFFWPSAQAMWQSVLVEDAFGGNSKFVWFHNFVQLFEDPNYFTSIRLTIVFSFLVAAIGLQFRCYWR
jgi:hypothetical protein